MNLRGDVSYPRLSKEWKPEEFAHVVDTEGNAAKFKLVRDERLGITRVQIFGGANPLRAGAITNLIDLKHLAPPRENRLYVITPFWEIIFRNPPEEEGPNHPPPPDPLPIPVEDIGLCVPLEEIPCSIDLLLFNPAGHQRLGTAVPESYEVVIPPATEAPLETSPVGGPSGGVIPHHQIPLRDDLSRVWDFGAIFGSFPSIQVRNNSLRDLGNFDLNDPAETALFADGFLCFTGNRYMIEDPDKEDLEMLNNRELGWEFHKITVGGIPQATTRS